MWFKGERQRDSKEGRDGREGGQKEGGSWGEDSDGNK